MRAVYESAEHKARLLMGKMIKLARRLGASEERAEDIAHEVVEAIAVDESGPVLAEAEFRRVIIQMIRAKCPQRRLRHEIEDDGPGGEVAGGPLGYFLRSTWPKQELTVFTNEVRHLVAKLPQPHRDIMELRIDGLSVLEISRETGMDPFLVMRLANEASEWITGPYLYEGKDAKAWRTQNAHPAERASPTPTHAAASSNVAIA